MYGGVYATQAQLEKVTRELVRLVEVVKELTYEVQGHEAQIAKLNKATLAQAMYIDQLEQKLSKQTDEKLAKFTSSWT